MLTETILMAWCVVSESINSAEVGRGTGYWIWSGDNSPNLCERVVDFVVDSYIGR